jgi:cobalt-zinc-cadmium efflux system membrane fusion protein
MRDMLLKRISTPILISSLFIAAICGGCAKSPTAANSAANAPANTDSAPAQNAGLEYEIVAPGGIAGSITATGNILVTEDRTASIGPVHDGRIVNLYAGQGTFVHKGQKLADLESGDVDEAEADYLKALADMENANRTSAAEIKFAQSTHDRNKLLFEKGVTAGKNVQQSEHDLDVARANGISTIASAKVEVSNARRHLLILGIKDSAIDSLAGNSKLASSVFSLTAPISGVVVERNATVGATVGSDANLFKIIDLSSVWIDANVFEKDLGQVHMGQEVKVSVPAFPGSTFTGRVILISSIVDPETRTVKVRTEVPNGDGRLKPDMFANVEIVTNVHHTAISLPLSAILDDGGKSVIFVADGDQFKKKEVTLGLKSNDRVEITDGLSAGDKVVVKGNYLLLEQGKTGE